MDETASTFSALLARIEKLERRASVRMVAYVSKITNQTGIGGTITDISGLTLDVAMAADRRYLTVLHIHRSAQSAVGATVTPQIADGSNTNLAQSNQTVAANESFMSRVELIEMGSGATVTRKGRILTTAGTLSVQGDSNTPALLYVLDVGPA